MAGLLKTKLGKIPNIFVLERTVKISFGFSLSLYYLFRLFCFRPFSSGQRQMWRREDFLWVKHLCALFFASICSTSHSFIHNKHNNLILLIHKTYMCTFILFFFFQFCAFNLNGNYQSLQKDIFCVTFKQFCFLAFGRTSILQEVNKTCAGKRRTTCQPLKDV